MRINNEEHPVVSKTIRQVNAEKRGWVVASKLIRMHEPRNLIAHEYASNKLIDIYTLITAMPPLLLAIPPKLISYANDMIRRYPV